MQGGTRLSSASLAHWIEHLICCSKAHTEYIDEVLGPRKARTEQADNSYDRISLLLSVLMSLSFSPLSKLTHLSPFLFGSPGVVWSLLKVFWVFGFLRWDGFYLSLLSTCVA
jgi:hypothetical protein